MDAPGFMNLLALAVKHGVSDIHLQTGSTPAFRLKGDLMEVKIAPLTEADMHVALSIIVQDPAAKAKFPTLKDFDGSFEIPNLSRFRYNVFRNRGKLAAVLRLIPAKVPSLESLGLPPVLKKIAENQRGLVLVTGATGSGKSSTLAAMIDYINSTTAAHILTIEDPVEFVHSSKRSRISQREIGPDTESFASALRAALRQDPDIILVGEMRDPETIDIALKAAETGHMVFSTVHTRDAAKTIGRLISVFPPEEQRIVRTRLADNLAATISQRLVKRADGKGLIAAQEIMVSNASIAECISDEKKTGEMGDYIQKSREISGGQTFDQHLGELYMAGIISRESALEAASNRNDFERSLAYGANGSGPAEEGLALDYDENNRPPEKKPSEKPAEKTQTRETRAGQTKTGTGQTKTAETRPVEAKAKEIELDTTDSIEIALDDDKTTAA